MTRIEETDSIVEMVAKLGEGNPGAMTVCMELFSQEAEIDGDSALKGIGSLLSLDTYGIYGANIWMLYKDVCDEDIEKTIAVLRAGQLGLISLPVVEYAIAHYGEGIDVDQLTEQVKGVLPKFGRERMERKEEGGN